MRLSVQLDAVALLRHARRSAGPDPIAAAAVVEAAGADSITVHLREDRRHVQERDVRLLRQTVQTALNIRLAPLQESIKIAYDIKPDEVTLLGEVRDDSLVASALDLGHHKESVRKYAQALRDADIAVRVLIDPDLDQVRAAHRADLTAVIFDTNRYVSARGAAEIGNTRQALEDAARAAHKLGMRVAAAGGLNRRTLATLVSIEEIEEVQVGHALFAEALLSGLDTAVRDLKALLR